MGCLVTFRRSRLRRHRTPMLVRLESETSLMVWVGEERRLGLHLDCLLSDKGRVLALQALLALAHLPVELCLLLLLVELSLELRLVNQVATLRPNISVHEKVNSYPWKLNQ